MVFKSNEDVQNTERIGHLMAASYIFTKDEFVYMTTYFSDIALFDEQFRGKSKLYKCMCDGNMLELELRRSYARSSLTEKKMIKFIGGKYAVEGVIYYIFNQMNYGTLMTGGGISKYECENIDVYVYDDRNNSAKCCMIPCRKNIPDDINDLVEMIDFLPKFTKYNDQTANEKREEISNE